MTRTVRHPRTLQARLVLGLVALFAILAVVIGTVSVTVLRGILISRVDASLETSLDRGRVALISRGLPLQPPASSESVLNAPAQSEGTIAALTVDGSVSTAAYLDSDGEIHGLPKAQRTRLASIPLDGRPHTVGLGGGLGDYRAIVGTMVGTSALLIVALPLAPVQATTSQLAIAIGIATLVALVVAGLAGAFLVRRSLAPLQRVAATAERVSTLPLDRGDVALAERVPVRDADAGSEVGLVAASFNRMLGHVASALTARARSEAKVRRFVSDASHELRTPLAAIRGYAELTRRSDSVLPADVAHALERIESESLRMSDLVDDLLLLARLDEGRELRREPVDLSALVIDAVSDARAAGPEHEWSLDIPPHPVETTGDRYRLHQVVANVLANARMHTPRGTRVEVRLDVDEDSREIVLTVTDGGPGIDPEVRKTLFERFVRGDDSRSRKAGSTGLGLAIVRAVVEAHGGTVGVESAPGRTRFDVRLPLIRG